jgi:hypothetical protein
MTGKLWEVEAIKGEERGMYMVEWKDTWMTLDEFHEESKTSPGSVIDQDLSTGLVFVKWALTLEWKKQLRKTARAKVDEWRRQLAFQRQVRDDETDGGPSEASPEPMVVVSEEEDGEPQHEPLSEDGRRPLLSEYSFYSTFRQSILHPPTPALHLLFRKCSMTNLPAVLPTRCLITLLTV